MDGLIGLDWGTSRLRVYRLDDTGHVLETRERSWGLRQLPSGGFDAALASITAGWPALPLLACGMVGSRRGWHEVAYVETPADGARLARALGRVQGANGRYMHIVPGLHHSRGPDVMRGEETQLVGALALRPELASRSTWILPGTHSKWVSVRDGAITDFGTWMTGELFAVLCRHSILGAGMSDAADDAGAFEQGVAAARDSGASGVTGRLFSTRTLMLDGKLAPEAVRDYLSGLLIGGEFRSAMAGDRFDCAKPVRLIGADALCKRYSRAAEQFGVEVAEIITDAAAYGLSQIAGRSGVLAASPEVP